MQYVVLHYFVFRDLPGIILSVGSLALASLAICYAGIKGIKSADMISDQTSISNNGPLKKEREAAMALSLLPGFGHRYLTGKIKVMPLSVFILSILIILLGILIASETFDVEWEMGWTILCYGFILMFFSWVWSALEVNELCNRAKLPHAAGIFTMRWEKTRLGISILYVVTCVLLICVSLGWWYAYPHYAYLAITAIFVSTSLPIALLIEYPNLNKVH